LGPIRAIWQNGIERKAEEQTADDGMALAIGQPNDEQTNREHCKEEYGRVQLAAGWRQTSNWMIFVEAILGQFLSYWD